MEERFAHSEEELKKYIGMQVSKEILLSRNYFYVEEGKVKEDLCLQSLPDLTLEDATDLENYYKSADFDDYDTESEDEDEEVSGRKVKAYLASKSTQSGWFKCLPSHPDDVEVGSAYILIRVRVDSGYKISEIHVFARMMDGMNGGFSSGGFFIEIPHKESMACHINHMPIFPPEVLYELDSLVGGRHFKPEMSLIGKPLPSGMDFMNGGPNSKTAAKCSAFRNAYWHISVDIDENGLIEDFSFSCWENEHSMFTRPRDVSDDIMDGLDCILTLLDAYTEEEYQSLGF